MATAIGSIVAVVALVWPDSKPPPGAKLSNVAVETNVTLADFSLRNRLAVDGAPPSDARRASIPIRGATAVLASAELALEPVQAALAEETSPYPPATDPQGGETEQQPAEPPAGEESDTPEQDGTGAREQDGAGASSKTEEKIKGEIDEEFDTGGCDLDKPIDVSGPAGPVMPPGDPLTDAAEVTDGGPTPLVGVADEDPGCPVPTPDAGGDDGGGGANEREARARALLKVLRGTRTRPSEDGRLAPMGVTVSFDATLAGFSERRADVRWSLYDARGAGRVPRDWLLNRRALQLTDESASDDFWVPLPKRRGPFFVRIAVYDDDGNRLTFRDSRRFR